ncbi:hypothetical protein PUR71_26400 [Streptomyces sp. SP17BM10]|uniref:hypothetical protein n=1 Tax=Streptomyces sp. SP17BM10 TaxID=3002530 RepID=UPI002E76A2A3|nr:hypothetical protein [Streptomyces sp. SP17BM10]MEE1786407.1 hypothetical protein [Streptomyces sp. SP17BM10]
MKHLHRALAVGTALLAFGAFAAPAASAAPSTTSTQAAELGILRVWHATVQCQIVRISDNNVVGYERADGTGNTVQDAVNDAARNVNVPQGHYKRHCDTKRTW